MAEEDNSQDKTEEPSQRKLDKAAEDGQVLSSKEMFVFTSLIIGLIVLSSILIPWMLWKLLRKFEDGSDALQAIIKSCFVHNDISQLPLNFQYSW